MNKPTRKPKSPCFGSGPTRKRPGWDLSYLQNACLGRGHRSPAGQTKLKEVLTRTREVLQVPDDYRIAVMPGSATGAMECALWTLLGARGVDIFAWDIFGNLWMRDIAEQLHPTNSRTFTSPFGHLPDLSVYTPDRDVVFTWNGTTTGVCVPNLDWIPKDREGLSICDATSAAFCVPLDWPKLDAVAFSWQKGLGGEAGHGMLVLSPRAIHHLQAYRPPRPLPRLFCLYQDKNTLREEFFEGATINTPSMLCVEDCLDGLRWAQSLGGLPALIQRCQANFATIAKWVEQTPWVGYLAKDPHTISPTSVCLEILNPAGKPLEEVPHRALIQRMEKLLADEGVAYDIRNHRYSLPSLRIWTGPTMESDDLDALFPWLEWAYQMVGSGS